MFSPTMIQASVYAGMLSNTLAILVCLLCGAWDKVPAGCMDLAMWIGAYLIHRKMGTW